MGSDRMAPRKGEGKKGVRLLFGLKEVKEREMEWSGDVM